MNTTKTQRQVSVLLLYAVAAVLATTVPSAWNWFRVSYALSPSATFEQYDVLRNSVELLRSENAHLGLYLNQSTPDPNPERAIEGIESSIIHELHEIKDLAVQPAPIGPAVRELTDFFSNKLRFQLKALRAPDADEAAKAAARVAWNDFEIYISRLGKASHSAASKRLGSVTSASTTALATTLWLAVLGIPALIVQTSHLRKRLASGPPGEVETKPAASGGADLTALKKAEKRAIELEHSLEALATDNAKLNAALEAANARKPETGPKQPAVIYNQAQPAQNRSLGFVGMIEALMVALKDRARATLARDGRFSLVAHLAPDEARSIESLVRQFAPTPQTTVEATEPPAATVKPTVLIVDDDRLNRIIFKQVLGPEVDALVVEASSVDEAWEKLNDGLNPDLIVTDLVMPERDGFVLIAKLRSDSRFKETEIIVCTSQGDKENISRACEFGIYNYIIKPFAKDDVQRIVLGAVSRGTRNNGRPAAFLEAQKRLGLDEEAYAQLAEMLSREVADTITFVRTALSRGYKRAAVTRMNSLRGSSQTVGDDGLAEAIMRVEKELETGEVFFASAELERLEEENARLSKSIIHLRRNAVPPVATMNVIHPNSLAA